jgi:hypothetical protein
LRSVRLSDTGLCGGLTLTALLRKVFGVDLWILRGVATLAVLPGIQLVMRA